MPGKESNPIQQRMDLLVEKWAAVVARPGVSVVRILARDNEKDMVNTFYTYLLGVDTGNHDIPVIFESIYHYDEQYTTALLAELEGVLHVWNNASKAQLRFETEPIRWEPDYNLVQKDNPAFRFVANMNRLAAHLNLAEECYLVAALRVTFTQAKSFTNWLSHALRAGIDAKFKIVVDDSVADPFYAKLANQYPEQIATLQPELDMDQAMQQIAAMGNPNDPGVQYRQAFVRLTQAIEKRKEKEAEKHAASCLQIAIGNLKVNPYWIGQVIAVYAALANDQIGYKNYSKAIGYSTLGVQAAEKARALIKDAYICRKFIAQAVMLRGSLYTVTKAWEKAVEDFTAAAEHYTGTQDYIMALEAFRMAGFVNYKSGNADAAARALAAAIRMGKQLPPHTIRFTTFAGVVELLMELNHFKYISLAEVETVARSVYGDAWLQEIRNWKNPHYEPVADAARVTAS